jgi:hypothetical protein
VSRVLAWCCPADRPSRACRGFAVCRRATLVGISSLLTTNGSMFALASFFNIVFAVVHFVGK